MRMYDFVIILNILLRRVLTGPVSTFYLPLQGIYIIEKRLLYTRISNKD